MSCKRSELSRLVLHWNLESMSISIRVGSMPSEKLQHNKAMSQILEFAMTSVSGEPISADHHLFALQHGIGSS